MTTATVRPTGASFWFGVIRLARVFVPLFASFVALKKPDNLSETEFPHLQYEDNISLAHLMVSVIQYK